MATQQLNMVVWRMLTLFLWMGVMIGLAGTVMWAEAHRPAEWRMRLMAVVPTAEVVLTERAQAPWLFTAELVASELDLGNFGSRAAGISTMPRYQLAMPKSPETVYCVLTDDRHVQRLVYVNYYNDQLYQADWVALAGATAPVSAQTMAALRQLGCTNVAAHLGH